MHQVEIIMYIYVVKIVCIGWFPIDLISILPFDVLGLVRTMNFLVSNNIRVAC